MRSETGSSVISAPKACQCYGKHKLSLALSPPAVAFSVIISNDIVNI